MDWTPTALAATTNTLWAVNFDAQIVAQIDPATGHVGQFIGLGITPTSVAIGPAAVWVLSADQNTLLEIDPVYGTLRRSNLRLDTATEPNVGYQPEMAVTQQSVWVADGVAVDRIDPVQRSITQRLAVGGVNGVAAGFGSVWAIKETPAVLLRIDPVTGAVANRIAISRKRGPGRPAPIALAIGADYVWVLNGNTGTVTRVDPNMNVVAATVGRVSMNATKIAAGADAVWIADNADFTLLRIDPTTNRIVRRIALGGRPTALVAGRDRVWVAVDST
jgi:hypothetical protein